LHPFDDGKAILLPSYDANTAYRKIRRLSERDAASYKKVINALNKNILDVAWYLFTPPSEEAEERFGHVMANIPEIPNIYEMNGYELVESLFEEEHVRTVFASMGLAIYGKAKEKYSGTFGVLTSLTASSGVECSMTARGGSSNLPQSLANCILAHGGYILENCEVEKIIVEDGEAKGVMLSEHSSYRKRIIKARKAVVSNLTAVPTFLNLVGPDYFDARTVKALRSFDYGGQTLFTTVFVTDDIVRWNSQKWDRGVLDAYWFHYGAESVDQLKRHEAEVEKGKISDPVVAVGGSFLFTQRDPSQAPPGLQTLTSWVNVPYDLKDRGYTGGWDQAKEEVKEKVIDRIEGYASGFRKSVVRSIAYSPIDIYRRNPSALNANFQGGNSRPGQIYLDRPFPGCGAPRTPIRKLYISNSIWPTSGSHLCTGYIAASVVAEDLGVRKQIWWNHEPLEWFRGWVKRASGRDWSPFVTVD
jgi:phytoene dehydrogenase-like protein